MLQLIKNGLIVNACDAFQGDMLVNGEEIEAVGRCLTESAAQEIDATGCLVLPGGVDPHVHMEMPVSGTETCDTFTSGTAAAAHGGTTTVIDFALQSRGAGVLDTLDSWQLKLQRHPPVIDVGLHMIVTDISGCNQQQLRRLPDDGVSSIKMFMAYKDQLMLEDGALLDAMRLCGEEGILPMVHAENGSVVDALVRQAIKARHTAPKFHAQTRPPEVEAMAVHNAIVIAELARAPLYLVHLSAGESIDLLADARAHGQIVSGETCPQYLFLDDTVYDSDSEAVAQFVFTPPARSIHHQNRLWDGLSSHVLSVISTDHCPFCMATQKIGHADFTKIPNGAPGVEYRLLLAYDGGVCAGRITLNRMVELISSEPAKLFGLYPRKGTLAPGSDADIVIFDPDGTTVLSVREQVSQSDYCSFEGRRVRGRIERVMSRGQTVARGGHVEGRPGHGQFVKRAVGSSSNGLH